MSERRLSAQQKRDLAAKVISLARRGTEFGLKTEALSVEMAAVQRRNREMVKDLRNIHEQHTGARCGTDLWQGTVSRATRRRD